MNKKFVEILGYRKKKPKNEVKLQMLILKDLKLKFELILMLKKLKFLKLDLISRSGCSDKFESEKKKKKKKNSKGVNIEPP